MPRTQRPKSGRAETSLYGPVKRYLETLGFSVKGEVCGCDLVALRGDEPPMVVVGELKLSFSLDLLLQAVDRGHQFPGLQRFERHLMPLVSVVADRPEPNREPGIGLSFDHNLLRPDRRTNTIGLCRGHRSKREAGLGDFGRVVVGVVVTVFPTMTIPPECRRDRAGK